MPKYFRFYNLAREYSTTTGTGPATLTGAVPGCLTWEGAGVSDGEILRYGITTYNTSTHQPTHSETGSTVYNATSNTITRSSIDASTNSGSAITLTGLSEIYICPNFYDFDLLRRFAVLSSNLSAVTVASAAGGTLVLNTEIVDDFGLVTLSSNTATFVDTGWFNVHAVVTVVGTITTNGIFSVVLNNNGVSDNGSGTFSVISGKNLTGDNFEVSGTIFMNIGETLYVSLNNNTSNSLDAYIQELKIERLSQ